MFTVLRRFSILTTMIMEFYVLGFVQFRYFVSSSIFRTVATRSVRVSVGLMILGSIIAAFYDLSFDAFGYSLVMINNISTSAFGVFSKQKLDAKELGKNGLLYYNCLFIIVPFSFLCICTGDITEVCSSLFTLITCSRP